MTPGGVRCADLSGAIVFHPFGVLIKNGSKKTGWQTGGAQASQTVCLNVFSAAFIPSEDGEYSR
jgi:hypothetical protein